MAPGNVSMEIHAGRQTRNGNPCFVDSVYAGFENQDRRDSNLRRDREATMRLDIPPPPPTTVSKPVDSRNEADEVALSSDVWKRELKCLEKRERIHGIKNFQSVPT
jgi:hypothetical protein